MTYYGALCGDLGCVAIVHMHSSSTEKRAEL